MCLLLVISHRGTFVVDIFCTLNLVSYHPPPSIRNGDTHNDTLNRKMISRGLVKAFLLLQI